jgi:CheY-like chemotaxis protein
LLDSITQVLGSSKHETFHTATESQPTWGPSRRPLRILVAEDNHVNQKLMSSLLAKWGHTAVITSDGREALAAMQQQTFDLVLMDVQMPEMNGFEATAAIRAQEQTSGQYIPIIALTAHAMKGDRERCLQAGMDSYIPKPIHAQTLFDMIENMTLYSHEFPSMTTSDDGDRQVVEILNKDEALARVDGDEALLAEMVDIFREEFPDMMKAIEQAVAQRDADALSRAAHRLKGAVGNFSAQATFEAALRLETMGRQNDLAAVDETYGELVQEIERLQPALATLTPEASRI